MKTFFYSVLLISLIVIGSINLSGCALFESTATGEIRVTKCDSVKVSINVPKPIPDIPALDLLELRWHEAEHSFYVHICATLTADKGVVEKINAILKPVLEILKIIYKS